MASPSGLAPTPRPHDPALVTQGLSFIRGLFGRLTVQYEWATWSVPQHIYCNSWEVVNVRSMPTIPVGLGHVTTLP